MKISHLLPLLLIASLAPYAENSYAGGKIRTMESYQWVACKDFEMAQDTVDVETILEELDASPYASRSIEFWTTPACNAVYNTESKVPMIFNTATDVVRSEKFPMTVKEYLLEVKNDKTSWPQIINTKSTDGLTFLDYLQLGKSRGKYSTPSTIAAADRIIKYLCQHGGVYSKYKNSVKCP